MNFTVHIIQYFECERDPDTLAIDGQTRVYARHTVPGTVPHSLKFEIFLAFVIALLRRTTQNHSLL